MTKIIFLEGLPGVGKSTVLGLLREKGVTVIEELPADIAKLDKSERNDNQSVFMKNDEAKIAEADKQEAVAVIDRGPLSTLAYNLVRYKLNPEHEFIAVVDWFSSAIQKPVYGRDDVLTIYLKGQKQVSYDNPTDPYGSQENLETLEATTLGLIDVLGIKHVVIDYDYQTQSGVEKLNEVLDSALRP